MTVYVDDMRAPYGRLVLCHMVADTEGELFTMARKIGVALKWYQGDHFDICLSKRAAAIKAGAREVTRRQLGLMVSNRRATGNLTTPETAEKIWLERRKSQRLKATGDLLCSKD